MGRQLSIPPETIKATLRALDYNATATAVSLGISKFWLSKMLNGATLGPWWRATKKKRSAALKRERERRCRERRKQRAIDRAIYGDDGFGFMVRP
jgi:hypothetical protein